MKHENAERTPTTDDESLFQMNRRRLLQTAGVGAASLTGLGLSAAQSGDENHVELEAVEIEAGGNGRGRSEYAWEDGEEGVVRGPPEAVCDAVGGQHVWMGVAPGSVEDVVNPTLEVTAGETYTVEWTNTDGETHNFVVVDADGNELVSSEDVTDEGDTQMVDVEVTTEMAEYHCGTHPSSQRGDIEVESTSPFELSGMEPSEMTIPRGEMAEFSVTATNTSDSSATQSVSMWMDGTEIGAQDVTLGAGESTSVTFEMDTSDASLGSHSMTVTSGDSEVTASMTVEEAEESEWIQLFNGEDIDDWTPKFSGYEAGENYDDTFTVEDGVLRADTSDYDSFDGVFGHLFYDNEFSHYMLRAEYRFVGEQPPNDLGAWAFMNNGLMLHGQTPEEMGVDQDYPDSVEVQLLGEAEDSDAERPTANVCTPGTDIVLDGELAAQHCTNSTSDTYRGDEWVTVTVVVRGNESIRHIVEDDGVVMSYSGPQLESDGTPIDSGTISIQSESHPTEFRTIELKEIDPDEPIRSGDPTTPLWSAYEKEQLAESLDEPQAIEVAPDGRVFFSTRPGGSDPPVTARIGVVDPETTEITTALDIDVNNTQENGLQSIALDPDFEDNGWIYAYYSPPIDAVDTSHKKLSRFTVDGDTIDPASEEEVLRVDTPVLPAYHVGGDIEFGPEGNLFLSVGDDTSPFDSSAFTPIDEREDEAPVDAQRTAANSNDLRGSILRITPTDDGGYEIPDGNMFTGDEYDDDLVRDEIYVMGCRNPFRMTVDEDGVLYWGEYGPDSREWDADRGPPGMVEFNRAEEPGYYGWPYVQGPVPYVDYDFETGESGEPFDPENLVNDSPKNTGIEDLPTPEEPVIWYPYSWDVLLGDPPEYAEEYLPDEPPFPDLEGGAPMGGPVFDHRADFDERGLPERFFDGRHLIGEWGEGNQWIRYVSYEDDGSVDEIRSFMPDEDFLSPMDMTIGPDGTFYLLEWGDGYAGNPRATNSGIYRIGRTLALEFEDDSDGLAVDAGTTTTLNATVTNPFDTAVESGEVTLSASDGSDIQISAVEGQTFDSLVNRESQSMSWEVTVPDSASGEHELTATASFTGPDGEADESTTSTTLSVDAGDPLEQDLEAYFSFDGDTPTNEVTGNDASVQGDVTTGQTGVLNNAYEFDVNQETGVTIDPADATAGGGVMTEPLPLNGEGATAAAWINFTDHEQWGRAPFQVGGSLEDGATDGWDLEFQNNMDNIYPQLWNDGSVGRQGDGTPIAIDPETWYFVVMVVDGGAARLHVFDEDGEVDASPQTWADGSRSQSDSEPLNIGVGQGYDMAGRVDEVYAYSSALSEGDVEQLYTESLQEGPVYDGLEARLTFDGDTPTNEVTGNDASVQGDVTTGQSGIVGNAYEFVVDQETGVTIDPADATSSGGVMTEPLPLNGDGATAAAWINFTDHEQWGRAPFQIGGSHADVPADGWNVQFEDTTDTLRSELWDGGASNGDGGTPISVDPETWYFVVMVVDGGDARVHVFDGDGELDASPQTWTGGSRSQSDAEPLTVGGGQGYDIAGRVDDVWAYSRALSESDVGELYAESVQGTE